MPWACPTTGPRSGKRNMDEYEVTFTTGEIVAIDAWTPEAARVIAVEDAELEGRSGLSVASVKLLKPGE